MIWLCSCCPLLASIESDFVLPLAGHHATNSGARPLAALLAWTWLLANAFVS